MAEQTIRHIIVAWILDCQIKCFEVSLHHFHICDVDQRTLTIEHAVACFQRAYSHPPFRRSNPLSGSCQPGTIQTDTARGARGCDCLHGGSNRFHRGVETEGKDRVSGAQVSTGRGPPGVSIRVPDGTQPPPLPREGQCAAGITALSSWLRF